MRKIGFILTLFCIFPIYSREMPSEEAFQQFLENFIPMTAHQETQLNKLYWIAETTGARDAADLIVEFEMKLADTYHNQRIYEQLLQWKRDWRHWKDPLLKRQLQLLIKQFLISKVPKDLIKNIVQKESEMTQAYVHFRPQYNGEILTQNDIANILKKEKDVAVRKEVWDLSKEIGKILAPKVVELVKLRNTYAHYMGYDDYFQMRLDLMEIDNDAIEKMFAQLQKESETAYDQIITDIDTQLAEKFYMAKEDIGPWAWQDPFCQKDPLEPSNCDDLVSNINVEDIGKAFYNKMGFSVENILKRSDLYPRSHKNQHAFCISIDRKKDVRILCNIEPTISWLSTLLHELGHAVYDENINPHLPWLLRSPPHMIPTEAMAMMAGRCAYSADFFTAFIQSPSKEQKKMLKTMNQSLRRTQLIFSRFVMMMHAFEKSLYADPDQDLNALWWKLVYKYQKVRPPQDRIDKGDWAAKYHIAFAPVYYYSYLLGEMFASSLQAKAKELSSSGYVWEKQMGSFLQKNLFAPGDRYPWDQLINRVLQRPLSPDDWIAEYAQEK